MRSASDLSSWSVDDVARYIADADSALSPYSDLFRKHVTRYFSDLNRYFAVGTGPQKSRSFKISSNRAWKVLEAGLDPRMS